VKNPITVNNPRRANSNSADVVAVSINASYLSRLKSSGVSWMRRIRGIDILKARAGNL
jgi:hypothetical protein